MFKKKSLLSEFSHYSGSYLLLSASLIFSLSSGTAYSAPPIKNSAGSVTFSGEAPELPGTEELGATGITTSDATENTTASNALFAVPGLTWKVSWPREEALAARGNTPSDVTENATTPNLPFYSITFRWEPPYQSVETTDSTPSVPDGASNAPLSNQDPMLTECSGWPDQDVNASSNWQAHFAMLLSELDSDPADGTNVAFPALDLVNPSLQEMELNNDSLNNDSLNGALLSIETSPANYTVIDLYYVLWLIAKHNGEQNLMKVLRLNAIILKRYLTLGDYSLLHALGDISGAKRAFLKALIDLRSALSQASSRHETAEIMTQFIFNDLYDFVHSQAMDVFELKVGSPLAIDTLTFLYELDQISAQLFDGNNYVEANNIAYARSRAWFFIFGQFGHRKPSPKEPKRCCRHYRQCRRHQDLRQAVERYAQHDRKLYSACSSLTALFTLFLGNQEMAYNMLERLSWSDPYFRRGNYSPDMESIVSWAVDSNLRMFEPPERNRIIQALSLMASNPFPPSSLHRTPETIRSAGNPEVLEALKKELLRVNSE
ncbi:hypothetical protein [Endozoicomonas sp. 4G]|uniref:hypothetical protein n=1 Tax=Endozoicomonas sp. 4G TaxID=2872754 RepID=UPI0020789484|nr:hypothetical protein [Endozoicomonas sp. 4G]